MEVTSGTESCSLPAFIDREKFDVENHIFQVDQFGLVIGKPEDDDGDDDVKDGDNDDGEDDDSRDISERVFSRIINAMGDYEADPEGEPKLKKLLLYFNGGLSDPEGVRRQAERQVPCMLSDQIFPVFMIWPTGFFASYVEQVIQVRNGRLHRSKKYFTMPFHVIGDIGQGLVRAPINYESQARRFFNTKIRIDEEKYYVAATCDLMDQKDDVTQGDCKFHNDQEIVGSNANVVFDGDRVDDERSTSLGDVGAIITAPIRLLMLPFVDSFGKTAWENMVRRTKTSVRRPDEYRHDLHRKEGEEFARRMIADKQDFPKGLGGFARFFSMLESCMLDEEPGDGGRERWRCEQSDVTSGARERLQQAKVTLIGHSMGTIVINEVVPHHPKLPYDNIVYMAGATSIRDTDRAITPLLERRRGRTRFFNLSLHPMNDAREQTFGGMAPSGSLLAWIDEMYDKPSTMLDRTIGQWRHLRVAKHVFSADAQKWMLFRVFNLSSKPDDPTPNPLSHGDFNDDQMKFWRPSFWGDDRVRWCDSSVDQRPAGDDDACR
ncbi:MAG: hypothetical protein OEU92_01500 [Alphaproteobacteria bacterium]|nr:hypothetical protein [Alphaproteobacteria bacterium]